MPLLPLVATQRLHGNTDRQCCYHFRMSYIHEPVVNDRRKGMMVSASSLTVSCGGNDTRMARSTKSILSWNADRGIGNVPGGPVLDPGFGPRSAR